MTHKRIGDDQVDWWIREQAETEGQKRGLKVPDHIKDKAYWHGFRSCFIAFLCLMVAWGIDSAARINFLSPRDPKSSEQYFDPPKSARLLKPRMENDSTFIVDMPVKDVCCKVDLVIPKGRCVFTHSITPIGVTLPEYRAPGRKPIKFKVAKYGGYTETNSDGSPSYLMVQELGNVTAFMNRNSFYGMTQFILDSEARAAYESSRRRSRSDQPLYIGVNIIANSLLDQANGFYRMRIGISRKCPR